MARFTVKKCKDSQSIQNKEHNKQNKKNYSEIYYVILCVGIAYEKNDEVDVGESSKEGKKDVT